MVAFLATPFVYGNTVNWVQRFSADNYGNGFGDIVAVVWFVLTAGILFCVARMTTSTLIVMGSFAVASRFFI